LNFTAPVRSSGPTGQAENAEDAEKRTLLFKRNRGYQAESRGETEGSRQEAGESQIAESEKGKGQMN